MTCVYIEYEVKIKMILEQWLQVKLKLLLRYNMKSVFSVVLAFGGILGGVDKNLVGGVY